jgi:hypothetical protein
MIVRAIAMSTISGCTFDRESRMNMQKTGITDGESDMNI